MALVITPTRFIRYYRDVELIEQIPTATQHVSEKVQMFTGQNNILEKLFEARGKPNIQPKARRGQWYMNLLMLEYLCTADRISSTI